jgi:hypothetical protein
MVDRRKKRKDALPDLQLEMLPLGSLEVHPEIANRAQHQDQLESIFFNFSEWADSDELPALLLGSPAVAVQARGNPTKHHVIAGGHLLHALHLHFGPLHKVPVLVFNRSRLGAADILSIRAAHGLGCWLSASIHNGPSLKKWLTPLADEAPPPIAHLIDKVLDSTK